jgi:hypothetical protein
VVVRACRKPSDALALRSNRLDPIRERLHESLQKFAGAVADELATFIEELVDMAYTGLRLLDGRHVKKHKRLPQMMIGAEGSDRARRAADDRTRLAVPDAASVRPGTGIQCILKDGRHRSVIFRRDEQNCISGLDAMTERGPWRGQSNCPISTMSSFIEDGASEISAFANIPLNDAFRKLPTNTHTFLGLSMAFSYDISVRSESGSLHS